MQVYLLSGTLILFGSGTLSLFLREEVCFPKSFGLSPDQKMIYLADISEGLSKTLTLRKF